MTKFSYTVSATVNGFIQQGEAYAAEFDIGYNNNQTPDRWVDSESRLTAEGVDGLLLGFASGLASTIHAAQQHQAADSAALLRKAIELLENQFVLVVNSSPVLTSNKPTRDGTEPEEIP